MIITLSKAFKQKQNCLPSFNFFNSDGLLVTVRAATNKQKVVVAAFGEGYQEFMPLGVVAAMAKAVAVQYNATFVLHLDHAKNKESIYTAIEAGFTSVMYDGSMLSLEENIQNTREIVCYAHEHGVSVEGELGYLNDEAGTEDMRSYSVTPVEDAVLFARETRVDALAVSVGNAHGVYRAKPCIDFAQIDSIYRASAVPLVLHGCSGLSTTDFGKAVTAGVRKLNFNTELVTAAAQAVKAGVQTPQGARLENLMRLADRAIEDAVMRCINDIVQ